ncbi:MAG: hypothetical protein WCH79_06425, partial [Planctomycetia bacterium]
SVASSPSLGPLADPTAVGSIQSINPAPGTARGRDCFVDGFPGKSALWKWLGGATIQAPAGCEARIYAFSG